MKDEKTEFSNIGFSFLAYFGIATGLQLLLVLIMNLLGLRIPSNMGWLVVVLSSLPMYIVGFPVCVFLLKRGKGNCRPSDKAWGLDQLAVAFIIGIGLMYFGNFIGQALMMAVNAFLNTPVVNPLEEVVMNSNIWVNLAVITIAAPVIEEYLFRKLLIDRIYCYGEGLSVLVSGLVFGLAHGNFYQFFYAFALGTVFAYIYVKTGRIRYSIVFHIIINFMGSILSVWLLEKLSPDAMAALGQAAPSDALWSVFPVYLVLAGFGLLAVGCLISGTVLLICFRKQITFARGLTPIPRGKRFSAVVLNRGMLSFLVFCLITFVFG